MVRVCPVCRAKVTQLGREGGVLCNASSCPYPRLGRQPAAAVGKSGWKYRPREGE